MTAWLNLTAGDEAIDAPGRQRFLQGLLQRDNALRTQPFQHYRPGPVTTTSQTFLESGGQRMVIFIPPWARRIVMRMEIKTSNAAVASELKWNITDALLNGGTDGDVISSIATALEAREFTITIPQADKGKVRILRVFRRITGPSETASFQHTLPKSALHTLDDSGSASGPVPWQDINAAQMAAFQPFNAERADGMGDRDRILIEAPFNPGLDHTITGVPADTTWRNLDFIPTGSPDGVRIFIPDYADRIAFYYILSVTRTGDNFSTIHRFSYSEDGGAPIVSAELTVPWGLGSSGTNRSVFHEVDVSSLKKKFVTFIPQVRRNVGSDPWSAISAATSSGGSSQPLIVTRFKHADEANQTGVDLVGTLI